MSELSPEARSLVEAGRADDAPSAEDKARIKNRLALELGAGVFASGALAAGLSEAAEPSLGAGARLGAELARRGTLKLLATAGSLAALVGGVLWVGTSAPVQRDVERAAPVVAKAPVREEPAPPAPELAEPVRPSVALAPQQSKRVLGRASEESRVRGARVASKAAPAAVATDTLAAELSLLSRAQQALRKGAPADALRIARQHASSFPAGALQEERSGIEALAHCLLGESKHAAVKRFLSAYPSSPVAARVRKECALP